MSRFAYSLKWFHQFVFFLVLLASHTHCQEWPNIEESPHSVTALEATNVTFVCRLAPLNDSTLLVTWQRNGQLIGLGRHRQALVHSPEGSQSSLELEHVTELDEGFYQCTARNDIGLDVSKPAKLVVQYGARISAGRPSVFNVTTGTKVPIECEARGAPVPRIELLVNNRSILDDEEPRYSNVLVQFVATETVNVTCRASNFVLPLNSTVLDEKVFEVFVQQIDESTLQVAESIETEDEQRRQPLGYCAPYLGSVCRRHLPRNTLVFYNMTNEDEEDVGADGRASTSGGLNEQLVHSLWSELIQSLQEPCRSAAETLLCVYAFPQCSWAKGEPEGKPLCREECVAVRESFCVREWALLEDNRQRGIFFRSRGHFRLPECESLPSHRNRTEPDDCTRSDLLELKQKEITTECIRGRGRFYQGTMNATKHGHSCQRWDQQTPHAHNRPPMIFPEMWASDNFCRNAGGEEPMPWCYTTDPLIRWQHCDIPQCESDKLESNSTHSVTNSTLHTAKILNTLMKSCEEFYNAYTRTLSGLLGETNARKFALPFALGVAAFFCLVILFIVSTAVCHIRQKRAFYRQTMHTFGGASLDDELDLSKLHSNATYHITQLHLCPVLEALEYPRNSLVYIRDIGQGAFGRVFVAKAPELGSGLVAVKVLRDEASEEMQANFTREATLMAEFEHPNVVKLLGVCAVGKPMCLLVEYMARGDLNSFLRTLGPSNYVVRHPHHPDAFVDNPIKLTLTNLLDFGRQIASGMTYLSEKGFVHRDLATRNCLIGESMEIKISDFGLSQRLAASCGFYSSESGTIAGEDEAVPIRWMALESITFGRYTPSSDVWAFGVVLWEIFTYALQPYYGMTHEQVIAYLNEGHVLTCPETCPPNVYSLMKTCWAPQPERRPTFESLERSIEELLVDVAASQEELQMDETRSQQTANESILSLLD